MCFCGPSSVSVLYFTISHANLCVAVSLYQLSMDGSFYHLELQLIWSRVNVAHGQLLTACMRHRNGEELEAWTAGPQQVLFLNSFCTSLFLRLYNLTDGSLSSEADLQQRVQNLKHRRLLVVCQQQDSKVQLGRGVLAIWHWSTRTQEGGEEEYH